MDPRTSAQDVMRCDLCETAVVQMHCDTCLVNLCEACVGKHFSADLAKPHKIVDFKDRRSTPLYPGCTSHSNNPCELWCKDCDTPVCSRCIANNLHPGHQIGMIQDIIEPKMTTIKRDHEELENKIYPKYQEIVTRIQERISQIESEYKDLSKCVTKHGEEWHRAIDSVVQEMKTEVDKMKTTHLEVIMKHLNKINLLMVDVKKQVEFIEEIQDSNDLSKLFSYRSRIEEIGIIPAKIDASVPVFTSLELENKSIAKLFGSLSKLSIKSEEHDYKTEGAEKSPAEGSFPPDRQKSSKAGTSRPIKQKSRKLGSFLLVKEVSQKVGSLPQVGHLLDEPQTVSTIDTGYKDYLYSVASLSDEEIWTCGNEWTMKLYSISQGSVLRSITTKSGSTPRDIAVTKSGDLIDTVYLDRTVNIVKNEKIEEVIRLQNWRPQGVCSTFSGDLLVIMDSDDLKETKVVCYSGSTVKQTIQFDDKGKPLYSCGLYYRYITENRNLDICVSDERAKAVVVVNQAGKLRFRYTGHTPDPKNQPFNPRGITTDSQSHILTTDYNNDCVHIIDQDGQFLRYIDCGLRDPWGLCTDTNDNLFVVQRRIKQVKKIKYLQ